MLELRCTRSSGCTLINLTSSVHRAGGHAVRTRNSPHSGSGFFLTAVPLVQRANLPRTKLNNWLKLVAYVPSTNAAGSWQHSAINLPVLEAVQPRTAPSFVHIVKPRTAFWSDLSATCANPNSTATVLTCKNPPYEVGPISA